MVRDILILVSVVTFAFGVLAFFRGDVRYRMFKTTMFHFAAVLFLCLASEWGGWRLAAFEDLFRGAVDALQAFTLDADYKGIRELIYA